MSRAGGVRSVVRRAELAAGSSFERTVYVGDGPWDVATCRELRLPLVGVAAYGDVRGLEVQGVSHVLTDYVDRDRVMRAIADAQVPGGQL